MECVDPHIVGFALVDQGRLGQRGAAAPLLHQPRVPRRGEGSGAEVGAHVDPVGVDPPGVGLGLGNVETAVGEAARGDVELADHARVGAAAGQVHQRPAVAARPQHARALPDPVLLLLRRPARRRRAGSPRRAGRARYSSSVVRRHRPFGCSASCQKLYRYSPRRRTNGMRSSASSTSRASARRLANRGAAGQRAEGHLVAVPDPVQRLGAGDVFQPPVRVLPRLPHAPGSCCLVCRAAGREVIPRWRQVAARWSRNSATKRSAWSRCGPWPESAIATSR